VPALIGALYFYLRGLPGEGWYSGRVMDGPKWFAELAYTMATKLNVTYDTVIAIIAAAGPVMMCFFFVDRPVRFALCVAAILGYSKFRQTYRDGNDIIYSERSFFGILKVEQDLEANPFSYRDRESGRMRPFRHVDDTLMIAQRYRYLRLVHGTTLHGQQLAYAEGDQTGLQHRHVLDDFQMILPGGTPWDEVAVFGATHAYDPRQEPLTYYHRTGPVGAMYNELRTRKGGADFNADVAMVGLGTGSAACYAHKGQHLTFYEIDPAVEKLVSDEAHDGKNAFFTFVPAARERGAKVTIRMGDARLKLNEDKDRQYALLLVDAFSSDSIPVHLLTTEAVQLYLDRMTEDGLLALHISNRWVRLEPVVSAIAKKLNLTARVWSDDNERGHAGKTASSWVVLARKPEYLGRLFSPLGDLPFATAPDEKGDDRQRYHFKASTEGTFGRPLFDSELSALLAAEFEELDSGRQRELNLAGEGAWEGWAERKYADLCDPDGSRRLALLGGATTPFAYLEAYRGWFQDRLDHADTTQKQRLKTILGLIREYGPERTLQGVMLQQSGHGFRRLESFAQVEAWTDDYADVMRVMDIPGLQSVRRFFGLATPLRSR
jgi:spermidine synthase